eukprot:2576917-Pyramimonas_sp.AAC.1
MDERGAARSPELLDWTSDQNIKMQIALGGAHHVMGPVERPHQVMRETLELWFEETGLGRTNLKAAFDYVPNQINRMMHHTDFRPAQWVLGYNLEVSDSLSADAPSAPAAEAYLLDCLLYTSDAADDTPCVDL